MEEVKKQAKVKSIVISFIPIIYTKLRRSMRGQIVEYFHGRELSGCDTYESAESKLDSELLKEPVGSFGEIKKTKILKES
jgi:hypothetical protein